MTKSKIKTDYGKIKIFSSEPAVASKLEQTEPIVLIPGYSESYVHLRKLTEELGELGLSATAISLPRQRGRLKRQTGIKPDALTLQTDSILEVIKQQSNGERVHVVAHSLGAVGTLRAALLYPDLFASITIMQPAGLTGKTTLANLAKRASKKTVTNQTIALRGQPPRATNKDDQYTALVDKESGLHMSTRVARAQLAGGGVIGKNPRLALEEAKAVRDISITDLVQKVTALGIPVNIVTSHSDELFDDGEIYADANIGTLINTQASFSTIADPKAGHDTFWLSPKRTARTIGHIVLGSLT